MELFAISCTTCQTRLKVRDESAIGKILSCPKCGGMVLIKPPADWQPGVSSPSQTASTMTATGNPSSASDLMGPRLPRADVSFEDVDQLLSPSKAPSGPPGAVPVKPKSAATKPKAKPTEHAVPEEQRGKATPAAAAIAATTSHVSPTPANAASHPARVPQPTTPPITPVAPNWSAVKPWRHFVILGGAIVTGTMLAIAVVMVTVRLVGPSSPEVAQVPVQPIVTPEPPPELDPKEEPPVDSTEPLPKTPAPMPTEPIEPVPSEPLPELPAVPPEPVKPSPADPLGIASVPNGGDANKPADSKVFGDLDKVAALLDNAGPKPPKPTAEDPPPPMLPIDTNSPPPRAAVNKPVPRKIAIAARLDDKLMNIDANGVPVADFLQMMMGMSTIPITLETKGMPLLQVSPESPIKLQATNTTVGAALAEGLKSAKLAYQVLDHQIVVTVLPDMRTVNAPVNDLTNDPAATTLIAYLTEFFVPGDWQAQGDAGPFVRYAEPNISIRHNSLVIWEQIECLEKMRVARGLPIKSKFDPKMFSLATRTERATASLAKPVSFNFSQPTSLLKITNSLGGATKSRILIDWRALLVEGWTPDTETTLIVDKKPLSSALDELVEPLELAWRAVDEQTFEITTPAALTERPELEIYKLPNEITEAEAEEKIQQLRQAVGEGNFSDGNPPGVIRFDSASKCLLVMLPQPLQRKIAAVLKAEMPVANP